MGPFTPSLSPTSPRSDRQKPEIFTAGRANCMLSSNGTARLSAGLRVTYRKNFKLISLYLRQSIQAISGVVSVALRPSQAHCRSVSQPPHIYQSGKARTWDVSPGQTSPSGCCVCFTLAQEANALAATVSGESRCVTPHRMVQSGGQESRLNRGTRVSIQPGVTF